MKNRYLNAILAFLLVSTSYPVIAQNKLVFDKYHNYQEVQADLKKLAATKPEKTKLLTIAQSPGGKNVTILQIGSGKQEVPAIVVGANFEGITPISTEGALYLANMILNNQAGKEVTWYIMPLPNPDASETFFSKIKVENSYNSLAVNNDVDEASDEDGFDDLNGDGFITQMRVKDPTGSYIISSKDERIMEKANIKKGERGAYKIYSEGLDNDNDGEYNEDPKGGINVGISFPHLFDTYNKESGLWSGYSPEVYGIMKFIYSHPEISMVFTLGTSDFCRSEPKDGRKGEANMNAIKVPRRYANMLGADTEKTYTMDEVIAMVKTIVPPGMEVTPSMIAGMLGLGAAVNPLKDDLLFYKKYAEEYKGFLKENNFTIERLDAGKAKDGSFELWAYYHLGVPSFSMNLFTVQKVQKEKADGANRLTLDSLKTMSNADFIALDDEVLTTFLKENSVPERMTASGVKKMVEEGKTEPSKIAEMIEKMPKPKKEGDLGEKDKALLAYIDDQNNGDGFVNWTTYNHPTLGEVEIGGYVPFLSSTPQATEIENLCKAQIPWLIKLSEKLPQITLMESKIKNLGAGIYELEVFVENSGELPYPISMGQRNREPAPVVIILEGNVEFLQGKSRTPLGSIGGNQVKKLRWLIKTEKPVKVTATIESKGKGNDVKLIEIGG